MEFVAACTAAASAASGQMTRCSLPYSTSVTVRKYFVPLVPKFIHPFLVFPTVFVLMTVKASAKVEVASGSDWEMSASGHKYLIAFRYQKSSNAPWGNLNGKQGEFGRSWGLEVECSGLNLSC